MTILTATELISAMRSAMQADAWLGLASNLPTIVVGHSGTFDADTLPKPSVVLAPAEETNPYPPVSRNAQKLIRITAHAYTMHFGAELGMIGDAYTVGVMPLIDRLESFFDDNLLAAYLGTYAGHVKRAHVLSKSYPDVLSLIYEGLNEARLTIEYLTINSYLA